MAIDAGQKRLLNFVFNVCFVTQTNLGRLLHAEKQEHSIHLDDKLNLGGR